jgi:hypothetical protein
MRIDIYHHFDENPAHTTILQTILNRINQVYQQGVVMAGKVDELLAELQAANETTNEIAADLDDLLARLTGGLSPAEADEVKAKIVELQGKLKDVAAKHTPTPPTA